MNIIKVIIIDDHTLVREGIASMLEKSEFVKILAKEDSGEKAINLAQEHNPDVILMDIMMKGMTGIEATRWIKEQNPDIKIILVSMEVREDLVTAGIKSGIDGYLPKDVDRSTLVEAIKTVYNGEKYFSKHITELVFQSFYQKETAPKSSFVNKDLTKREKEVLEHVAMGKSNQEVADSLFISIKTVESHKTHILEKLGLKNTAELVKYAIKNNIIEI